ncbi:MAG TPA: hypothetical protein VES97_10475, partial [Solirubrobacteraceae bacterium]|nr:hypothetical protein [Solirubrobacteraceae bacterium]
MAASDLGDAEVNGETSKVTITDKLPPGVVATKVEGGSNHLQEGLQERKAKISCSKVTGEEIVCAYVGKLAPYEQLQFKVFVTLPAEAPSSLVNEVTVEGGGAKRAVLERPLKINAEPTSFGVESYELKPENEEFEADSQSGSHPFQLTTAFDLNEIFGPVFQSSTPLPKAPALERNLAFKLPPGLIGNVNAVAQCPDASFGAQGEFDTNSCQNNTAVGVANVTFTNPGAPGIEKFSTWVVPVFNLVPAPGEPARFGFSIVHVPVVLDTSVRTGGDYGVTVSVHNASEAIQVLASRVTFWGIPGDKRHDRSRGWACFGLGSAAYKQEEPCDTSLDIPQPPPFLMLPTSCGLLQAPVEGVAWDGSLLKGAGEFEGPSGRPEIPNELPAALTGCDALPFDPSVQVIPDRHEASTPTGMTVKVNVPQQTTLESSYEGKAEADVRSTKLELPVGLQASPASATGLGTCSVAQAGFNGSGGDTGKALESELEAQGFTPAAAICPEAAKIGTVNIKTPVLEKELRGAVYLAQQNTNPFASPLVLYIVAEEEASKVLVKLAGEVQINSETGQLTSYFKNTPQSPFETLTLHLTNGDRASQATPAFCGEYHATATFTTWSGEAPTVRTSNPAEFKIASGPNGTACPGSTLPFGPDFKAGVQNPRAGEYSPFELTIEKPDGQQALESITTHLPPGLAARIAGVTPCPDPQAIEALPTPSPAPPACGPESLVGHTTTTSGLGGKPVTLVGDLYLTESIDGAPFGLLAVTHAKAGPFDLGYVNVLSTITINEGTAAVTTKTIKPIPRILDGVPVQLKQINVTVDRPEFEFNPTNCTPMAVTGSLAGWEGASDPVTYPFVV